MSAADDVAKAVDRFMLRWGVTLVILMVAVAVLGYGCGQRHRGEIEERIKHQTDGIKVQTKRADSIRTVYVHDTVTAYRYLTEWEQVVDTLRLDTLPPAVRTIVIAGDSAVRSCTRALHDCDALQRAEHDRADSALALADLYRKAGQGPWVSLYGEALHDLAGGTTLGAGAILGRRLALTVRGEADLSGGPVRAYVGVRVRF